MKFKYLIAFICFNWGSAGFSQNSSPWAANFVFFHQDAGFKLDVGSLQTTNPVTIRPGFSLGLERTWDEGKRKGTRLFQDLHAGFWQNPYSENYLFLGTRLGADIRIFGQLRLTPSLIYRIGRAKTKDIRYAYEEGKWVPTDNSTPGFLRQTLGLDIQWSWRFAPDAAHPIDFQVGANWLLALKYMPVDPEGAPNLYLYKTFRVGLRYGF
ncbi:hypothetical protein [Haliscomenobacter sp.]|uniref:hypothetical protein n=1 Tax=Haliscomenobacter sp. TaxID=2717303 RepID=UPI003BABE3B1